MPKYGPYDKNDDHTYALGVFPSMELLKSRPESVRCLLVNPAGYRNAGVAKLIEACRARRIPVEEAPRAVERISGKENAWCVTVLGKYACRLDPLRSHVVLHNPSDCGNVGTILRTALGFGVEDVALIRPCVGLFDPRVVRASMGSMFSLRLRVYDDFARYRADYPAHALYPFMLDGSCSLPEALAEPVPERYALVFGNEGSGLPGEFAGMGQPVRIPSNNRIDSLNLAVAAAIGIYGFTQRHGKE